jgi:UDP-glucuronate 4-epimerase
MNRILVTGGAGFIGSHLCERLLHQQKKVAIIDNLDDFYDVSLKKANLEEIKRAGNYDFFQADIRDEQILAEVFEKAQPEAVVHLAARAGVRPSLLYPDSYVTTNVQGTARLLELSRKFHVKKFVFASSSSVYGKFNRVPFSEEDAITKPLSVYAATKVAGEALAFTYSNLYEMPVVCLRIFTAFGPRQRPDLAIRKFAALIKANKEIPVFGDGSMSRDYTFVSDVVAAIGRALDYEGGFDIFNLGNSRTIRLDDLITTLEDAMGTKAKRHYLPAPPGEMPVTFADLTKSRQALGYDPKVPFEEGIRRFVEWFKKVS